MFMAPLFAVLGLSGGELILVLAAVLILFGAKKIPDFAKGLGQGLKEFKKASREVQDELERAGEELNAPPPPPPPPAYASPAETVPATEPTGNPPATAPSSADGSTASAPSSQP
jgi:sec-independent protein translocase protein TatA